MEKTVRLRVKHLGIMLMLYLVQSFSCKKNIHEKPLSELQFEYSLIGDYHQSGLEFILEAVKETPISNEKEPWFDQVYKTISTSSVRFTIKTLGLKPESEKTLLELQESITPKFSKSALDGSLISLTNLEGTLTERQVQYLEEIDLLLSENYYDVNQYINGFKNLENQIYFSCSPKELPLLFIATSVGASSITYWYNNLETWENEIDMSEVSAYKGTMHKEWFWGALGRMGRADIAGGLVGAGFGALAGGVGAIPGGLAGACQSSAICGIVVIYEHVAEN